MSNIHIRLVTIKNVLPGNDPHETDILYTTEVVLERRYFHWMCANTFLAAVAAAVSRVACGRWKPAGVIGSAAWLVLSAPFFWHGAGLHVRTFHDKE